MAKLRLKKSLEVLNDNGTKVELKKGYEIEVLTYGGECFEGELTNIQDYAITVDDVLIFFDEIELVSITWGC